MTGAAFAATPIRSVSGERRQTAIEIPPRSAPFPTGTTTAAGGASSSSKISSAIVP